MKKTIFLGALLISLPVCAQTPTRTPIPTPTPVGTIAPTRTPIPTPTPVGTTAPTATPTITNTPEPTPTFLPTNTPTATPTPTVTPTAIRVFFNQINAGGSSFTATDSTAWASDNSFSGGTAIAHTTPITGSDNSEKNASTDLFQSKREGTFAYGIGIPGEPLPVGTYSVDLHFSENDHASSGQREFNVLLEATPVATSLDVYDEAGAKDTALTKTYTGVQVSDGYLSIHVTPVTGDPMISGIEVYQDQEFTPPTATPTSSPGESLDLTEFWSKAILGGIKSHSIRASTTSPGSPPNIVQYDCLAAYRDMELELSDQSVYSLGIDLSSLSESDRELILSKDITDWSEEKSLCYNVYKDYSESRSPDGAVHGYFIHTKGFKYDYLDNSTAASKTLVEDVAENAAFARDSDALSNTAGAIYLREVSEVIMSYIDYEQVGSGVRPKREGYQNQILDGANSHFFQILYNKAEVKPFMVALAFEALLQYHEHITPLDANEKLIMKNMADYLWTNAWRVGGRNWACYKLAGGSHSCQDPDASEGGTTGQDLTCMIAPIYSTIFQLTGDTLYRDRFDEMLEYCIDYSNFNGAKQWTQQLRWILKGLEQRG